MSQFLSTWALTPYPLSTYGLRDMREDNIRKSIFDRFDVLLLRFGCSQFVKALAFFLGTVDNSMRLEPVAGRAIEFHRQLFSA